MSTAFHLGFPILKTAELLIILLCVMLLLYSNILTPQIYNLFPFLPNLEAIKNML